jgi:transposase
VAQEHEVNANLLFNWRTLYSKGRLGGRAKKLLPARAGDTAPAKRSWRQWSIETKQKIVAATLVPGANVKEIAQAHGVRPSLVYHWRKKYGRKRRRRKAAQVDLLQVTVTEANGSRSNGMPPIRAIEIDLPKGRVRIMGADAALLQAVLELLR